MLSSEGIRVNALRLALQAAQKRQVVGVERVEGQRVFDREAARHDVVDADFGGAGGIGFGQHGAVKAVAPGISISITSSMTYIDDNFSIKFLQRIQPLALAS